MIMTMVMDWKGYILGRVVHGGELPFRIRDYYSSRYIFLKICSGGTWT